MLYMVTFTINIPPMLAYIPAPWILWVVGGLEHEFYVSIYFVRGVGLNHQPVLF
jgi:hypothetical protein